MVVLATAAAVTPAIIFAFIAFPSIRSIQNPFDVKIIKFITKLYYINIYLSIQKKQ